jgi:hypothetical protein
MKKARKLSKAAVMTRAKYWRKRLHLEGWKIGVTFEPDEKEESEASCLAQPEYAAAVVRFDLAKIHPDEIDSYIVHELLHCHVWALANFGNSACADDPVKLEALRHHEESLVTSLERLVMALTKDTA